MKTLARDQYLMLDGIKLISMYGPEFPYDAERCRDLWAIPGRQIMGTQALINHAVERGVPLTRTTFDEGVATTVLLT